jgi:hypothetical protein
VRQYTIVTILVIFLIAMNAGMVPAEKFFSLLPLALVVVTLVIRFAVWRLPSFLVSPHPQEI